ncbi:MAG: cytochrome P450 [Sphingobium sp.]
MSDALFTPPFPPPFASKLGKVRRFVVGMNSWIHVLFEKSYKMKMGEARSPGLHIYLANELDLIDQIMSQPKLYPKHTEMVEALSPLIGNSLLIANGDEWEEQRAMVGPAFQLTALARTLPMMVAAADELIARVDALIDASPGRPIDIDPLMTHVAADVIFRALFSVPLDTAGSLTIHRAFNRYQRFAQAKMTMRIYRLPTFGLLARSRSTARAIHKVFEPIVRERYERFHADGTVAHDDILQSLFAAKRPGTGTPFTYQEVMEQVQNTFLAGHETTASLMAWALYLLGECPAIQERVRAEVDAVAGDAPFTGAALREMRTVRNVMRETLRLYPPVPFLPREVQCPVQMRDKHLEPGAMLVVSPWLVQRHSDNWTCPHAFDPDRFDRPEDQERVKDSYIPFGKGPRTCTGAGFAQQEAMIVIAAMTRRYRIAALPGDKPEPVGRITLRARRGLRLKLERR